MWRPETCFPILSFLLLSAYLPTSVSSSVCLCQGHPHIQQLSPSLLTTVSSATFAFPSLLLPLMFLLYLLHLFPSSLVPVWHRPVAVTVSSLWGGGDLWTSGADLFLFPSSQLQPYLSLQPLLLFICGHQSQQGSAAEGTCRRLSRKVWNKMRNKTWCTYITHATSCLSLLPLLQKTNLIPLIH